MGSMKDYIECDRLEIKHKIAQFRKPRSVPRVRTGAVEEYIQKVVSAGSFSSGKFDVRCGLNRKLLRNFQIQRQIDLHGYTQDEAFNALLNFFARCQMDGIRNVLVITGGNAMKSSVLRNSFRKWVKENFSALVVSYTSAKLKDGGQGAFYAVVRKKNSY